METLQLITLPITIGFAISIPTLTLLQSANDAWAMMMERTLSDSLRKKGLLRMASPSAENNFADDKPACAVVQCPVVVTIGMFDVLSLKPGLDAIRSEFQSFGLLSASEIAWMDNREGIWRNFHPAGSTTDFKFYEVLLIGYLKMMIKRCAPQKPL